MKFDEWGYPIGGYPAMEVDAQGRYAYVWYGGGGDGKITYTAINDCVLTVNVHPRKVQVV